MIFRHVALKTNRLKFMAVIFLSSLLVCSVADLLISKKKLHITFLLSERTQMSSVPAVQI